MTGTHDNKTVSVVIPVYNLEDYIERCLRSDAFGL